MITVPTSLSIFTTTKYSVHKSRKLLFIDLSGSGSGSGLLLDSGTDVTQVFMCLNIPAPLFFYRYTSGYGFRSSKQSSSHLHVPVFGSTGMFTDTLSGWDRPPPTADLDVKKQQQQQQQPNTYGKWQCVAPPPPTTHGLEYYHAELFSVVQRWQNPETWF
ncbi:uncharacterized protein BO87DRAFT_386809 [Aspergillus neoniger CBS 115656]|uniref:Uncharacterized protein n=1 Tax=Aspergillus neoniger (strain CBS 115656) TaxID=1448310 RepID=A0A318YQH2_ASPNB|nr:hypothetical protein BO87DRAFT_386809 [Aspergillus neoniger CBS 115656]PYH34330.1 hypothetical protein BO87DRAFT_386809 [Aspergillus neoniger CBS 115656]